MTLADYRNSFLSTGARVVVGAIALLGAMQAPAFAAESPLGVSTTAKPMPGTTGRQLWRISDYTTVELVAREAGAPDNQHPVKVEASALVAWLQPVQVVRSGAGKPLFGNEELQTIAPVIAEALAHARPDQDIALVSAARHDDNTFYTTSAVTARLFEVDGHLNFIVNDARNDFYDKARGSGAAPHFTVGSRATLGASQIQGAGAANKRSDWLVLDAAPPPVPAAPVAPVAPAAPVAPVAPVAPIAPVAPAAPMAPPAPVAPVPPAPPANDAEARLVNIKRLYDKGLITKSEYDKKRAEIIKGL